MRHAAHWDRLFDAAEARVAGAGALVPQGRLVRAAGLVLEASGLKLPLGAICRIQAGSAGSADSGVEAEVVGFERDHLLLMPTTATTGLSPGARVAPCSIVASPLRYGQAQAPRRRASDRMRHLPVGEGLLGRVVDAAGTPLDGLGPLHGVHPEPIHGRPMNAMDREPIRTRLDTGVRAIDGLLTIGRGQRIGLFAQAGVGKSVLLGMMARYTQADVTVVALVGERGREVKEFIEDILGATGRQRAAVIAAPADVAPLLRMQAAVYACAVAEHFRDQGLNVLLLMDSLTRYAMAAREVALAAGEPPATRGYPPSVFARLPQLVERSGNGRDGGGSITAFYTVLIDGEEHGDPIGESARSFLDGHIVLSRELADSGHFPAIDVEQSLSRLMQSVAPPGQIAAARAVRAAWSRFQRNRELLAVGAYVPGGDVETDRAIAAYPAIAAYLRQDAAMACEGEAAAEQLQTLASALAGARTVSDAAGTA